jgi:hypothetical protein
MSRITIVQGDSLVGVDRVFRTVDLSVLPVEIHVIQYDTEQGRGIVEFDAGTQIERKVRDHDLEHDEALAAGEDREKIAALEPRYKTVMVPRPPEEFTDFAPYQPFVDAWLAAEPVVVPPTLADVRMRASAEVDRAAGSARARYITIVAGQEGTYIEKEKQAEQFRAAGYPTKAIPLMIDGEAQASGLSAQQACDFILETRDGWLVVAARIELERRKGKVAIDAAKTAADIAAAKVAAMTALAAI